MVAGRRAGGGFIIGEREREIENSRGGMRVKRGALRRGAQVPNRVACTASRSVWSRSRGRDTVFGENIHKPMACVWHSSKSSAKMVSSSNKNKIRVG